MFVRACNLEAIAPIEFIFSTRSIIRVARSSSQMIRTQKNVLKDSSRLRDRAQYAIKVCHDAYEGGDTTVELIIFPCLKFRFGLATESAVIIIL